MYVLSVSLFIIFGIVCFIIVVLAACRLSSFAGGRVRGRKAGSSILRPSWGFYNYFFGIVIRCLSLSFPLVDGGAGKRARGRTGGSETVFVISAGGRSGVGPRGGRASERAGDWVQKLQPNTHTHTNTQTHP